MTSSANHLFYILFAAHLFLMTTCSGDYRPPEKNNADTNINLDTDTDDDLPAVRIATEDDENRNDVELNNYIVAFRPSVVGLPLYFATYRSEYQTYYSLLSEINKTDQNVVDIDFITSVDLKSMNNSTLDKKTSTGSFSSDNLSLHPLGSWFIKAVNSYISDPLRPMTASLAKVTFADHAAAKSTLLAWHEKGLIWYADPNYKSKLNVDFKQYATDYTDLESQYWWLKSIKLANAFNAIAGIDETKRNSNADIESEPPVIAVMDSGVDYEHPQLKSQVWENPNAGQLNCETDTYGCNTTIAAKKGMLGNPNVHPFGTDGPGQACPDCSEEDEACKKISNNCKHGTHVAGIIVGQYGSSANVAGVCPFCKILIVNVVKTDSTGEPTIPDDAILKGFKYLSLFRKKSGNSVIRIINSSFGKLTRARSTSVLVRLLSTTGTGALVIAAAGNEETMRRSWPAAVTEAIAVSAVDKNNKKTNYSNFGPWVDIAAPGGAANGSIQSTAPGGGDHASVGTSQATPVVSGVAGLVLALYPGLSFEELRGRIVSTADPALYSDEVQLNNYSPKISGESIRRPLLGSGLVDANAAVTNTSQGAASGQILTRVKPTCGVVQMSSEHESQNMLLIILLMWIIVIPYVVNKEEGN